MPRRSRVYAAAALTAALLAACSGAPPSGPPQALNTSDTPPSAHPTPLSGEVTAQLRRIPSGSERGYPLALSRDPDCMAASREPSLVVHEAGRRLDVPVEDPNDLVARHTASRCLEIAVTAIADLHWDGEVVRNGEGPDATAGLVLVVEPTGERGSFTIEEVNGTPVLAPLGSASWKPGVTVSAAEGRQRVELPMIPPAATPTPSRSPVAPRRSGSM